MPWPKLIRWTLELIIGIRRWEIAHEDCFCGSAASYHCRRIARTGLSNVSVRRNLARAWNGNRHRLAVENRALAVWRLFHLHGRDDWTQPLDRRGRCPKTGA